MSKNGFITVGVSGLKELEKALSVLPEKLAQKVIAQATAAGAAVVRKEAKQRCPVVTGNLRRAIRIKRKFNRCGKCIYQVGPGRGAKKNGKYTVDGYYGHMVEFGTSAHVIKPKNFKKHLKAALRSGKATTVHKALGPGGVFGSRVNHPGARAQPFLRPAFDSGHDAVIRAMRRRIKIGIEQEARKLARGRIAARRRARL